MSEPVYTNAQPGLDPEPNTVRIEVWEGKVMTAAPAMIKLMAEALGIPAQPVERDVQLTVEVSDQETVPVATDTLDYLEGRPVDKSEDEYVIQPMPYAHLAERLRAVGLHPVSTHATGTLLLNGEGGI